MNSLTQRLSPEAKLAAFKNAIAGQYLIDAEVGRGGMAVVYAAREVRLGRSVALKVLAPSAARPSSVDAFPREIHHTVQLEHPNIIPLLDAGRAEGLCFYVMRLVRGGSLQERLRRHGRFSVPDTVSIVLQTAAGLQYAHDHQVLHCDVKPGNILLDGWHVYLADFGISRAVRPDAIVWEGSAGMGSGGGTASYVSPEQALGEPLLDGRTDLYSLACVAYELLVGHPPFTGGTDGEIVARRFTNSHTALDAMPPDVPDPVVRTIARALSLEPAERQSTVTEFADGFARSFNLAPYRRPAREWVKVGMRHMVDVLRPSPLARSSR